MKFVLPSINLFGEKAIEAIMPYLEESQYKTCLIITDKFMVEQETFKRLQTVLMSNRTGYKIYDETKPNPTVDCVQKAFDMIRYNPCELIISLGGGSAHDLAKAVGIVASNGGCIRTYEGVDKVKKPIIPLICINTTSGTGSETTRFTIVTDETRHVKMAIIDDHVIPWIAVNDTKSLLTMPKSLTAATGMDALTHAIEAFLSTDHTELTDSYALKAMQMIYQNIQLVYEDGLNTEAREIMAKAQYMAGVAFSNASLGYVHAIAHQLGGFYNLPHGLCNAVLLPIVMKELGLKLKGRQFVELNKGLGLDTFTATNIFASKMLVKTIEGMNQKLNIPLKLAKLGIKLEDLEVIAENAKKDPCSFTSPVQFSKMEIVQFLKAAY